MLLLLNNLLSLFSESSAPTLEKCRRSGHLSDLHRINDLKSLRSRILLLTVLGIACTGVAYLVLFLGLFFFLWLFLLFHELFVQLIALNLLILNPLSANFNGRRGFEFGNFQLILILFVSLVFLYSH